MDELTKVSFTNLEKIIYPGLDLKKSHVLEYYIRIAPLMLGSLKNRVIVMNRYPDGVLAKRVCMLFFPLSTIIISGRQGNMFTNSGNSFQESPILSYRNSGTPGIQEQFS